MIRSLEGLEQIRPVWSTWRGHRDADIDVYETLINQKSDAFNPYIVVVERNGCQDAILIGTTSIATIKERIGYWTVPVSKVRVLSVQYGGFLGNQSTANSWLIIDEVEKSLRRGELDIAIFSYVREDAALYQTVTRIRSMLTREPSQSHWVMDLPTTRDEIYARISPVHRKKLKGEAKRFRAAYPDLRIVCFRDNESLTELVTDVEQIAARTYQRGLGVGFSDTPTIRELLAMEANKGWLRGYVLYDNRRPCAFWIGAVYDGIFLSEYLGHDPAYSKYSPGTYLLTQVMEEFCGQKISAIDFGIGEAFYKQRFGNRHWNESTVHLYAPTWKGMGLKSIRTLACFINSAAKRLLERLKLAARVKKLWRQRAVREASGQTR